jgi:acyl-CoA thioester hydrolase
MGHMNVMWYVGKFDEACWQLLSEVGLTRSRFRRDGSGMAAVEQHIHYERELHAGDVVSVRSRIVEVRDKSIHMRHELWNDETSEIAAVTEITGVHIDAVARKARSLPADVRERVFGLFAEENNAERDDSRVTLFEECR